MTRRAIADVLGDLDRAVQPSQEFADALFARLEAEMADAPAREASAETAAPPGDRVVPVAQEAARRWFTRPLAVAAGVLVIAITAVALGTLPGGTPSALAAYEQAREQFAGAPSVIATVEQRQFGEVIAEERIDSDEPLPDLVVVKEFQWADADHFRMDVVSNSYADRPDDLGGSELPEGSFEVTDGEYHATFNAAENTMFVEEAEPANPDDKQLNGLGLLDPSLHYFSTFTDAQLAERCDVLPDAPIAGRPARHIQCTEIDAQGTHDIEYDLWLDLEYGTVLRYDINGTPSSSGWLDVRGSVIAVQDITYGAELDPGVFTIEVPKDAKVEWLGRPPAPPQFSGPEPPKQLTVPIRGLGSAIAVDGDVVWVAGIAGGTKSYLSGGTGTIHRVDAITGDVLSETRLRPMHERPPRGDGSALVSAAAIVMSGEAVWVGEHHAGSRTRDGERYRIEKLDRATGQLVGEPVELPGIFAGMAEAKDSLWVAAADTRTEWNGRARLYLGEIQQLDSSTGDVLRRVKVDAGVAGIAASADGRQIWVLADEPNRDDPEAPDARFLYRIDTASGEVVDRTALPVNPREVHYETAVVWGDDAVYVTTDAGGRGRLIKVDAGTGKVVALGQTGEALVAAAFGHGALWVVDGEKDRLLRINAETLKVESSTPTAPDPVSIAVSPRGVWLGHYDGSARFFRTPK